MSILAVIVFIINHISNTSLSVFVFFFFFLGKATGSKVTWYERMCILAVIVFIIYHISNTSLMSVCSSLEFSVHKI